MRRIVCSLFLTFPLLAGELQLPPGHHAQVFAQGLEDAGELLALEDGTVLVSRPGMNDVLALRDRDGDGRADEARTAVASVEQAHGLAMRGRTLYVAGVKKIVAAERQPDGSFRAPKEVITDLPDGGQHPHRAIGFGPDGRLYVSIGSSCSDCTESNPEHAAILQFDADGGSRRIYARGLRDAHGLAWHPSTRELWTVDEGELNRIGDGLHYGWPLCSGNRAVVAASASPDGITKEKFCGSTEAAALALPAMRGAGLLFDAHGALSAAGTKIVRVTFDGAKPSAASDFVTAPAAITGMTTLRDAVLFGQADGVVFRVVKGDALPQPMTSAAAPGDVKPVLAKAFSVATLRGPVAVVHDAEQDVYFVSNVDGAPAAKDGNGFIARITPEGKVAELKFIDGLDAPKGMAIRGTELWVADIDRVRVFDRVTGAALKSIDLAEEGAVFLEDVAIGPDDSVFITDTDVRIRGARERVRSGDGRIFRIYGEDKVEVAISGDELRSPSGIAWDGTRFLVAQAYGNEVLAWNPGMRTKAVLRGPGAYDGIVVLPSGTVIVSSHHDDALHVSTPDGKGLEPLFARRPSPGDIGFDQKRNRLLIPSFDGDWLEAWTLPPLSPARTTSARDGAMEMAVKVGIEN